MTFKRPFYKFLPFLLLLLLLLLPQASFSMEKGTPETWKVRCNDKNGKCEVFQRYIVKETGQRIIEFAIGYPGAGQNAMGAVILPLGIKLNRPVRIKIADQFLDDLEIESCSQDGCVAHIAVDSNFINSLQNGDKVSFIFSNLANQIINIEMATKGFAEAFLKAIETTETNTP